ncbi:MAG TPA: SDR family oxidoreductase [Gaiellaceae bacterium]|nr:SDR family oxidoreductase [Gaiellaceae bacterium]
MSLQTPNSRALVAGGTGRIGAAIAARLEAAGYQVFAAGRADGDLRTRDGAQALLAAALARLGSLDLVVHCAGDGFVPRPVAEVSEDDWAAAMDVTAKGTFFLAQAAAEPLRESRGVLVIVEDVAAFRPWPVFAPHCAAKAAQAMLTRVLAEALAPEVRVCGVAPGPVAVEPSQTERRAAETLLRRVGEPADVAEAVLYLARAPFVTGTSLVVDGGALIKSGIARLP